MSKATGTYPAYVTVPPPPSAPAPSASAPQQAVINSQGQNLPPSSDQFQARLCACAQTPQKTCCRPARPWCFLDGCNQPPLSSVVRCAWALLRLFVHLAPCKPLLGACGTARQLARACLWQPTAVY